MGECIRVVLADDHCLVRAGLRSLLAAFDGVEVVGEADDGGAAIARVGECLPDVLLIDIAMKDMNGLVATAEVHRRQPAVRVVVLSMHADAEYVLQALQAGAVGYLIKDAAPVELELALRAVMRGENWLSPSVSRQVVDGYLARVSGNPPPADALTPRQSEILCHIAAGHGAKEIAFDLGISAKTVESHRAQIMERLGIHDVAGLTRYAIRNGLVSAAE
ncbi:MAG: Nitrogen regulation protein C [Candidatus Accumulibacter appositus]|uniref:Nitrogen regulation protein C n=1 Tax=Candidatus Accumulibacter appositus TaxID=1454003 RepID=A0A011QIM7_9PROT|nr:response regulator transcription factor [Accumulibacter sp.]EXI78704.1 MAG: Nitrogen regulation protein C [Candidatus Accumulibacter appositus]HRF03363.1 response regulator transcription factor [Accumulibacter sp.]